MVIRLMTHSNALLHELLSALPVDVQSSPRLGQSMIFKDSAHVIEQPVLLPAKLRPPNKNRNAYQPRP